MRTRGKVLLFVGLPVSGAAAGYLYLIRVLQPVAPALACPGPLHDWRCRSYELIVSKPCFVMVGALIGTWFAYALVRLSANPRRRNFAWREALVVAVPLTGITAWVIALHPGFTWIDWGTLRWDEVLLFLLAAVLVRIAIGIASIAEVRGGLILAFSLPIIFSGLGYVFIKVLGQSPVGHSCPGRATASACVYHPLIGQSLPWMILGLLAGLWVAYAVATDLAASRQSLNWMECAVVLPAMVGVVFWAVVVGPDQAGRGDVGIFLLAVALAASIRLLLAERSVKNGVSSLLAKIGMVNRTEADAREPSRAR